MKKNLLLTLAGVLLFAGQACAGDVKIHGTVSAVDVQADTIAVVADDGANYTFHVNESTDIEKKRDMWFDKDIRLNQLRTGDRVKVEYERGNPQYLVADEVEVYPKK